MKREKIDTLLAIGCILAILFCTIPFKQVVEVNKVEEYTSLDNHHVEVGFGGPSITWVTVRCNRTAEIRFLHQSGVWISTQSVLLASYRTDTASYNFNSEHSTVIIEVISDGPILVYIVYTYLTETVVNLFSRTLYSLIKHPQNLP